MQVKTYKGNKNFELAEFKAVEENGLVKIRGYANNKNIADRYGDIPTPFNREYVYELTEFRKNPILLLNHNANIGSIAGKITEIHEDVKGLYFEAEFTKSAHIAEILHAKQLVQEGILKTVSIGGIWLYEDFENPDHLTLAKIFEISLVTIPADTYATFTEVKEPQKQAEAEQVKEVAPDYTALQKKMAVFEMKSKLEDLEVKTQKPAKSGKEQ